MSKKPSQKDVKTTAESRTEASHLLAQQWEGPLPPPAALEHFNRVIPNGADRIMQMVELEQSHRHQQDSRALDAQIKDYRRGHWLGAGVSAVAILGAVLTAYLGGHFMVSIALVGLPVATIILAILGKRP